MSVLFVLVPLALVLAAVAVYGFLWAVQNGQYDDVHTPALRVLLDEEDATPTDPSTSFPSTPGNHEHALR